MSPRCPECHQVVGHGWKCSQASIEEVRRQAELFQTDFYRVHERIASFIKEARRWEAKYRTVKHENNQLRKKLYPPKPKPL